MKPRPTGDDSGFKRHVVRAFRLDGGASQDSPYGQFSIPITFTPGSRLGAVESASG
jgi:hypothetical protein